VDLDKCETDMHDFGVENHYSSRNRDPSVVGLWFLTFTIAIFVGLDGRGISTHQPASSWVCNGGPMFVVQRLHLHADQGSARSCERWTSECYLHSRNIACNSK
jgi:hypothetical protein